MSTSEAAEAAKKWEYMEITRKTEGYLINELNDLGQQGWELVSVLFHQSAKSGMGSAAAWVAILKRPFTGQVRKRAGLEKARDVAAPSEQTSDAAAAGEESDVFDLAD